MNIDVINKMLIAVQSMRHYHRHEIRGLHHIPSNGPVLLVVNHSLATYDIMLLTGDIYLETGRITRHLVDRLFFRIPLLAKLIVECGGVEGAPDAARKLLDAGEIVCLAPGGMREALRPSSERYQIRWDRRMGFAKLAITAQVPIILAACPKADDLYDVIDNPLTKWIYQQYKLPLVLARGFGFSIFPRPVKLTHFLSEPIQPPPIPASGRMPGVVQDFQHYLIRRMNLLIGEAVTFHPSSKGEKLLSRPR